MAANPIFDARSPHPFIERSAAEGADDGLELPDEVVVELPGAPTMATHGDATVQELGDGTVLVDLGGGGGAFGGQDQAPIDTAHDANLAEHMDEGELDAIATDVLEGIDADLQSRAPWFRLMANGMKRLGVEVNDEDAAAMKAFQIAKNATFPLISEAVVQFQARFIAELFPPSGPVKSVVYGTRTDEREEQSLRVEDYLNYQLTLDDRGYFPETDQLGFMLPIEGSIFRKAFNDPSTGKNLLRMVRAEHFIVNYDATSLEAALRFTHRQPMMPNEVKKFMASGYYRDVPLQAPSTRNPDSSDTQVVVDATDRADGRQEPTDRPEDIPHTIEECYCDLDLKKFPDLGADGTATGIKRPYIVHVERESRKILAIYRNWKEDDQRKVKLVPFSHYRYLPGTGFYGWGLFHAIGGLDAAATGILRTVIVGGAFASVPGGFKARDGAKGTGDVVLEPGVFKDSESTFEELSKTFYTPEFKAPSEALFRVLGLLVEAGQRFMSTTEQMVGDANNTGPVGTTVALIEQGSKVFSAIHKRCHFAAGVEFRLLAALNYQHLPAEGYPYEVPGESRQVFRDDFSEAIDVEPVSDPNIFSSTQRIAIAQAGLQLADSAPDLYNRREAHRRMHAALRTPDIDGLMPAPQEIQRADPVTENALAMIGRPIRVFPDQDDDAHVAVHMGDLEMATAQGRVGLEQYQPVMVAHVAEHQAQALRKKMAAQLGPLGAQMPAMDLYAEGKDAAVQQIPPQVENMLAMESAKVMAALLQQLRAQQAQAAGQPGADEHAAEEARRDQSAEAEQRRKDQQVQAEIDRKDAVAGLDPATVKMAGTYLRERGLERAIQPRQLAVVSRALNKRFDDVVGVLMAVAQGGQGSGPAPAVMPTTGGRKA